MINIVPINQGHIPLPVNPIERRPVRPATPVPANLQAEPVAPTTMARKYERQRKRNSLEWFYLLTAKTRRALLEFESEPTSIKSKRTRD